MFGNNDPCYQFSHGMAQHVVASVFVSIKRETGRVGGREIKIWKVREQGSIVFYVQFDHSSQIE